MKTELESLMDRLIENGHAGIAIEHKILEWRKTELAEKLANKPLSEEAPLERRVS
ncbi:hypothetical protein AciPR4_1322 [Terriglobus saanensis SP1PR4]|uniref:Uncharacterized protein n=1 Tax=Terriglobus saanensis (strain ATCC BAA-1853 / DSM 23119 / SP1PR4) TaxID=401053 RepID=E8UZZ1_TERSS|nr:hypothetical protein AciPR4_1322 [Terriglobus saanensis SP1PR4]